jgi:hypothetical protein
MATKKHLVNRWLEEPGRTIAAKVRERLLDYSLRVRELEKEAHRRTGLYQVSKEYSFTVLGI